MTSVKDNFTKLELIMNRPDKVALSTTNIGIEYYF